MKSLFFISICFLLCRFLHAQEAAKNWQDKLWLHKKEKRFQYWTGGGVFIETSRNRFFDNGRYPWVDEVKPEVIYSRDEYAQTAKIGVPWGLAGQISGQVRLNRWFGLMLTAEVSVAHQYLQWYSYDSPPYTYSLVNQNPSQGTFDYALNQNTYQLKNVQSIDTWAGLNWRLVFQSPGGRFGFRPGIRIIGSVPILSTCTCKGAINNKEPFASPSLTVFYSLSSRLRVEYQNGFQARYVESPKGNIPNRDFDVGTFYRNHLFMLQYQLTKPKD